jgi:uncharacterized membrane protein YkvA (DUF1232 family)
MSIDISITLSDEDLKHCAESIQKAVKKAETLDAKTIISQARAWLAGAPGKDLPDFVSQRLASIETMITMVEDVGFGLPDKERDKVLAALTYFADPNDVIPDSIPVLGFLDDAIMIELCVRELRIELDAYEDFSYWRTQEAGRRGEDPAKLMTTRVEWAESRRVEAIERMHRRQRESYVGDGRNWSLFSVR